MAMPDVHAILYTTGFAVGSLVLVVAGVYAREALAKRRGFVISRLIVTDHNAATALEQSAFVLAAVMGLYGALVLTGATLLEQALQLLLTGALVVGTLLVNDWLTARLVCRGLDVAQEVHGNANLAVALVRAASALATSLVLRSALGHESALLDRIGWLLVGQAALVGVSLLYQRLTRYDDVAELGKKNIAAALPMAGVLLAVGITLEAALRGEGAGWAEDLQSVGIDLGVSLVFLQVLRKMADVVLLPGSNLHDEIARDRNVGAGLIEMTSLVVAAWTLAFFLN